MEVEGQDNISLRNILEGHPRPIELRRIHPFGIMTGVVLDKKKIDALERAKAGKANQKVRTRKHLRGGQKGRNLDPGIRKQILRSTRMMSWTRLRN